MKIYDCFSYWDEDLLLDLRLNILNEYVDYFVIVEGNKTWQNNYKKLRFKVDNFDKFKNKIIYVPVKDLPDGNNPYLRENHQRNCISRGLVSANENGLIIRMGFRPGNVYNESDKSLKHFDFDKMTIFSLSHPELWLGG